MRISIFSYWFKCIKCKKETSISSSSALEYDDKVECIHCKCSLIVKGLKSEPKVELSIDEEKNG